MSARPGGEKSGLPPVPKDHPLWVPCGSHHEEGDFRLSFVCCLNPFKRGPLEDIDCGNSSELSPRGTSPVGAATAPKWEEINSQKRMTGRRVHLPS